MYQLLLEPMHIAPNRPRQGLLDHLSSLNVEYLLNSRVLKMNQDGIDYLQNEKVKQLTGFDCIVLAFGSKPNQALYHQMQTDNVHLVGDALRAKDAKNAIYEATQLALK